LVVKEFQVLYEIDVSNVVPTGFTTHNTRYGLIENFSRLQIGRFGDGIGYYLFYFIEDLDAEVSDTFHDTLEQAFGQAELEFNIKAHEWIKIKD
jgi:hypothetical protein